MSRIYIYNGPGASEASVTQLEYSLPQAMPHAEIVLLSHHDVKQGSWMEDAALFVMPGGADVPYCRKLNGVGNQKIRAFVENGGAYFGICAGAYYACASLSFDAGGESPILGKRELAFIKGEAVGPILASYDFRSMSGARIGKIQDIATGKEIDTFFNGGPYFMVEEGTCDVLAHYMNEEAQDLPAIVTTTVGKGRVLLSATHIEYSPHLLSKDDPCLSDIIPILEKSDPERAVYFKHIVERVMS